MTDGNDHAYAELIHGVRGDDPGIGTTLRQALAIAEVSQITDGSDAEGREVRRERQVARPRGSR